METRTTLLISATMLALLIACAQPADNDAPDPGMRGSAAGTLAIPTEAEVRATIATANQNGVAAMKTADIAALYANYADDAVIFMPGMPPMKGRAAIEEGWRGIFATTTVNDASFNSDDIVLSGDVAIENGSYQITSTTNKAKPTTESGRYLTVWQRQSDGGWRIIRDMSTPDSAAAPGTN